MSLRDRLFGKKEKKQDTPATATPAQPRQDTSTPSSLLEYLDRSETANEVYEVLRTRSTADIEELCRTFPIETLHLDWDSIQRDFRNNKRFEVITVLAQILVRYDDTRAQSPELRLPSSLPAKQLADILMSRLMPFIKAQQNVDIAQGLRIRLYDFAMALIQAGRYEDALACLLASRPSMKDDHEFWIFACRYNIAATTKNPDAINAAIMSGEDILSGRVKVPEKGIEGVRRFLPKLKQLQS